MTLVPHIHKNVEKFNFQLSISFNYLKFFNINKYKLLILILLI